MGVELAGKTLGLIGCGNIGSIVADRAHGLKMKVVAYDPFLSPERAVELGVEKVELDELLARADFITLHTPLTDQTRGILSREALAKTKPGVRIVNCARGGLIDEAALKDALDSGHVAGAALDVFAEEPAKDNPLFGTPRPDLHAAPRRLDHRGAGQCRDPGRRADERLSAARRNHQRRQRALAVGRGSAAPASPTWRWPRSSGGWSGRSPATEIRSIDVEVEGAAAELNIKPITGAVLAGRDAHLVGHGEHGQRALSGEGARHRRARNPQRGRRRLSHAGRGDGRHRARRPKRVEGTLFGNRAPRLVNIFGVPVEAELAGQMIYIVNTDAPGFIGALGTEARRERHQHRDLQPRPPRGGRRGGRAGRGRRPDHAGRVRNSCTRCPACARSCR